ncbi:S-adenosyl-L-methionine-dependent methyltransferase [Talaromyces proteolyticus]|uniref:S-adenosyl-L-methionine-dependent methyltransferase n=1 Tax=Talaromyces proteolyticus TaxID=1131652 RepID=A0AAD4PWK1_9EURO|nr:S-adenosyl-L-methionine-dependent methyltransferase [Talaromyces proteolyticus]KAH8692097.1 S-adenosyl-L-methionine-dependent methyltransferase [Talaromyces proteolyticus]
MSLRSSLMMPHHENGRIYHGFNNGSKLAQIYRKKHDYVLPSDEEENDRLDLQHHIFLLTFDARLYNCPVDKSKTMHNVLDIGTGTGIWALDFADTHPEASVLGVDIGANQPSFVPPNLSFLVDDLENQWAFSHKFEFIYSRMMTGSIANWPRLFEQAFENLNPGGYMELADISFPARVDDDSYPENSALRRWSDLMLESAKKLGRYANSAALYKRQMIDAGFVDVVETIYPWPTNHWPKDPKLKELGRWVLQDVGYNLSGISMALFTRGLRWTAAEVEVFLVDVRKEFKDAKIHCYFPIYVVWGRKPDTPSSS